MIFRSNIAFIDFSRVHQAGLKLLYQTGLLPNPDKPEPKVGSKRHLSQRRQVRKEGQGLLLVLKPKN
jgi:hypothetical protein